MKPLIHLTKLTLLVAAVPLWLSACQVCGTQGEYIATIEATALDSTQARPFEVFALDGNGNKQGSPLVSAIQQGNQISYRIALSGVDDFTSLLFESNNGSYTLRIDYTRDFQYSNVCGYHYYLDDPTIGATNFNSANIINFGHSFGDLGSSEEAIVMEVAYE